MERVDTITPLRNESRVKSKVKPFIFVEHRNRLPSVPMQFKPENQRGCMSLAFGPNKDSTRRSPFPIF
jgi:hypothetical protein